MINYKKNPQLKILGAFIILEILFLLISNKFGCYSDPLMGGSRCASVKFFAALLWIPGILAAILYVAIFLKELYKKTILDVLDIIISIVAFLFIVATLKGWTF